MVLARRDCRRIIRPVLACTANPESQQTRCPASSVLGTDKWSADGVVWWRGSGQEQERLVHDAAGISNDALGVWFRFREMMAGTGSVQGCQVVRGACVPSCRPACGPPEPLRRLRVSACVPKDKGHEPVSVWTAAPAWLAWVPGCLCGLLAGSGSGTVVALADDWSRRGPTRQSINFPNWRPTGQIRPFPSSINHMQGLIR